VHHGLKYCSGDADLFCFVAAFRLVLQHRFVSYILEYYKVTSVRYAHELENIINSREKVRRALVSQRLRAYAMEVVFALRNVRYSFAGNQILQGISGAHFSIR